MLFSETDHAKEIQRNAELWDNAVYNQQRAQQIRDNIAQLNEQKESAGLIAVGSIVSVVFYIYMVFQVDFGQTLNIMISALVFLLATVLLIMVVFTNQNIDNQIAQQEEDLKELFRM